MRAGVRFFWAMSCMTLRNRQALFWTLFFPVLFMLATGFIGGSSPHVDVAVVTTEAGDPAVVSLLRVLGEAPSPSVAVMESSADATRALATGDVDAVLVIPPNFTAALDAALRGGEPVPVRGMYRGDNPTTDQAAVSLVAGGVREFGLALTGVREPLAMEFTAVETAEATYLEFVLPGLIGVMLMNSSLGAIGMGMVNWRLKGVLKRLSATPLSPPVFLSGLVGNQVVIGLISAALMILLAVAGFGARAHLLIGPAFALVLLGLIVFLALGFFLAGLMRSPESAAPLVNLVALPMMLLSGVFYPADSLPGWMQPFSGAMPLTYLVQGLRAVLISGSGWAGIGTDLLGLGAWAVVAVMAAVRTFRWHEA